jgi:nucleotide-binding universal stress UspA family protein
MARIVVGVDGSPASVLALRWALREARARGAPVEAVIAWRMPGWFALEAGGRLELTRLAGDLEDKARTALRECLRAAAGVAPDISLEEIVVRESPPKALLDIAQGADLLVVGSRGRGGLAGLRLGSVSSACVAHAPCPVVVVHPPGEHWDNRGDGEQARSTASGAR